MGSLGGTLVLRSSVIAALSALTALSLSCSKEQRADRPSPHGAKPAVVSFPGMQLRPGETRNTYTLIGRVKNHDAQRTIREVRLRVTMEDVLVSGAATTVGEAVVVLRHTVPPGESTAFEEAVRFSGLPETRGNREWNYSVAEIIRN